MKTPLGIAQLARLPILSTTTSALWQVVWLALAAVSGGCASHLKQPPSSIPALTVPDSDQVHGSSVRKTVSEATRDKAGSSTYLVVRITAAAAAEQASHSLTTQIEVERLSSICSADPVTLEYGGDWRAVTDKDGNPPVLIQSREICLRVSKTNPPRDLIGLRLEGEPATQDQSVGAQYLSPDPESFEALGASLYVPGAAGGYLLSAFAEGGTFETNSGLGAPFPSVAIALDAEWLSGPVSRAHYFLVAETPGETPLADALSVRVGIPKPGDPPPTLYQDDVRWF